jgi:hypothetical protein
MAGGWGYSWFMDERFQWFGLLPNSIFAPAIMKAVDEYREAQTYLMRLTDGWTYERQQEAWNRATALRQSSGVAMTMRRALSRAVNAMAEEYTWKRLRTHARR